MGNVPKMSLGDQVSASAESKQSKLFAARRLAPLFQVDVVIKMFGIKIFEWHFPPTEDNNTEKIENPSPDNAQS